jgi:tetratricopeptide (TPR) repeat protein
MRTLCVLAVLATLAFTHTAAAQSTEAAREEARVAFVQAQEAAEQERWADALQGFEQAYLLSGVPTALYNAAMVLRALGRHRDARDAFDRLLTEHEDYAARDEAQTLRDAEAARVAVLELVGLAADGDYTVRLDGRTVPLDPGETANLETDAGRHAIVAEREGFEPFTWEDSVRDGQRVRIEVIMEERETESRSLAPILVPIAAVLAVAGVVLTLVFVRQANQLDPATDNVMNL